MSKSCDCKGRPCYECSVAGGDESATEEIDDSFAAFLGYD